MGLIGIHSDDTTKAAVGYGLIMTLWIVDISNHQGDIDIGAIAEAGYSSVICKATEGRTFRDGKFDRNIPLVKKTGMIPGAYHFLRSGSGVAQARALHSRVTDHGGPTGWLCACDNEADATWTTTRDFFEEWAGLTDGHPLLMYTGAWWWDTAGRRWDGASLTPYLWHSRYVNGSGPGSTLYSAVPHSWWSPGYGGWTSATILQFSSSASVAGQRVDVNAYLGTLDQLRSLTTSKETDMQLTDTIPGTETTNHPQPRTLNEVITDLYGTTMMCDPLWADSIAARVTATRTAVEELASRPTTVTLTDDDRSIIAAAVVDHISPLIDELARITAALGGAGVALGILNEQSNTD